MDYVYIFICMYMMSVFQNTSPNIIKGGVI